MESLGGPRKTALLRDREKYFEMVNIHTASSVALIESYELSYGITHCYVGIEIITLTFSGAGLYDCRTHMTIDHLKIFDTTLRDGEQSPGCSMNLAEKVRLARKLQELGVD